MRLGELIETLQDIYEEEGDMDVELSTAKFMINGSNKTIVEAEVAECEGIK